MKQILDIDRWERKAHFDFFRQFEEPFFGLTVHLEMSTAMRFVKRQGYSLFLYYLHCSLKAANQIKEFRYRIEGDQVIVYDKINASPTINRPDGTFGFAYMEYFEAFEPFSAAATEEIERVQKSSGLVPALSSENVIHFSSIPWIDFSSLSHARSFRHKDSIPKISFGKITGKDPDQKMPVSIHAHHGLMDGYHVSKFIELFQDYLNGR